MQDILGSVRRSLVFRPSQMADGGGAGAGGSARIAEKIGSCIRKSRVGLGLALGIFPKGSPSDPPEDSPPAIRWRKGELIGCGAFGRVYMGMNLDSGELLAIKQVLIGPNNASREKAQAHICELEEEVKLLRNLSHSNIVRYLGTAREEETLNILMEFVPGGSISSLLGKFGSFPEAVIRMYTKQLLLGLEYLHKNGIMHRDIKGANILVDNKGCIKLADFGASKQVAELATMTAAKSMKGTPYWMAPEVILRTGHSFSADIWSVGCTVIEMATGKPPWSEQFQEVAALYHVGSTKSHPPIPEQLSANAKDFLLKCLQKEPSLRSSASDLLQHPFVTGENKGKGPVPHTSTVGACETVDAEEGLVSCSTVRPIPACGPSMIDDFSCESTEKLFNARPMWEACMDDDMCELGEGDDLQKSFNPMSEPLDDWPCKLDMSSHEEKDFPEGTDASNAEESTFTKVENDFTFPCLPCEDDDDDELTESKIRAFLDEKALDLKKLQTPLYEFYNTLNSSNYPSGVTNATEEKGLNILKRPPRSKLSPSRMLSNVSPTQRDASPIQKPDTASTSCSQNLRPSVSGGENRRILREIPSPKFTENGALQDSRKDLTLSQSLKMKWEEELAEELARGREMLRQGLLGFPSPAK